MVSALFSVIALMPSTSTSFFEHELKVALTAMTTAAIAIVRILLKDFFIMVINLGEQYAGAPQR